ncbi:MAG: sulfotransferase family protein [Gemmataceae bacterium]|nr:sulfotransferase family protein [Gemmataceae bacterium]
MADTHLQLAKALIRENQETDALAHFEQAAQLDPRLAEAQSAWGAALIDVGRTPEAIAHLQESLRLQPDHVVAFAHLSELVNENCYRYSEAELAEITRLLGDAATTPVDRSALHFALAYVQEKQGQYDDAFAHFRTGHDLKRQASEASGVVFESAEHTKVVDDLIAGFTPEFFQRVAGFGNLSDKPVLIVGMPRSGTTLVDQVLSAHPDVAAAGELMELGNIVADLPHLLNRPRSLELLSHLDRATVQTLARRYLRRLEQFGGALPPLSTPPRQEEARVTDKMPQNFFYLGFVAALFPNARIIHCRRDAMDTCVSCYTHHFTDFARSLEGLGFYYRQYERLMAHWSAVLPLRMFEVRYEDLVASQEGVTRTLIDFCGLEWHDACLKYYDHRRAVHTASRMQVRQPIYTSSLGRWRRYAAHLEPLLEALGQRETRRQGE